MRSSSVEDGEAGEHRLKRHLGSFNLTMIGLGAIIGAGIFVITGQAAALYAGPGIVLSFIFAALICLFAGLCYAELSALIPVAGGAYTYAYVAMGEFPAWIVGWSIVSQYLISFCVVSVGWSGYFVSLLKDFNIHIPSLYSKAPFLYSAGEGWFLSGAMLNLPAMFLVAFVGALVSIGIKTVAYFNNAMVVIKVSTVILFVLLGLAFFNVDNLTPFIPQNTGIFGEFGWSGILRGAGLVFFAYIGFDTVSTLAQEAKNPQTDLPRGILGSLGISTIAYIAMSLVLLSIVSYKMLNVPDPIAVALTIMGPKYFWFALIVKIAILAALASVVLVQILGLTRVLMAKAQDGLLPKKLGNIHPKMQTPLFATIIVTAISVVLSGLFPVSVLAEIVSMATLFLFAIVCLGVLVLRSTHPELKRPFKVPLVPWVPLLGIVACLTQIACLPVSTWIEYFCWMGLGLIIYFSYGINRSKLRLKK